MVSGFTLPPDSAGSINQPEPKGLGLRAEGLGFRFSPQDCFIWGLFGFIHSAASPDHWPASKDNQTRRKKNHLVSAEM